MKSHVGTNTLDEFCENTQEHHDLTSQAAKDSLKGEAFERWMSFLLAGMLIHLSAS